MHFWLAAALAAFVVGSFAEYCGQRMMHLWLKRAKPEVTVLRSRIGNHPEIRVLLE